jgi:4-methyl-5(b-hydroxyethyl)-thiazole monophosphate biosynthesis
MSRALILLAPGCEELEAVTVIDVLRRAGVEVVAAGLKTGILQASRDVKLMPDLPLDECHDAKKFDMLILPGGLPGTEALREDLRVRDLVLHYMTAADKKLAAICAAALVLDRHGLLEGRTFTCYPKFQEDIEAGSWQDQPVVVDGDLITSQGPGTAMAFALTLVEILTDADVRNEVAAGLLV